MVECNYSSIAKKMRADFDSALEAPLEMPLVVLHHRPSDVPKNVASKKANNKVTHIILKPYMLWGY